MLFLLSLILASPLYAGQAKGLPPEVLERRFSPVASAKTEVAFSTDSVTIVTPLGVKIRASLRIPKGSEQKKNAALLVFGGFEQAAHVLTLLHPTDPIVLASFDYPFAPPREFRFPESLRFAPEAKRAVRDTIDGIQELVRSLRQRADVDPNRITVLGASFGGPFAIAAASREPGISGLVLIHAFGDVPGTAAFRLQQAWSSRLGIFARPVAQIFARLAWLYLDAPNPEDAIARMAVNQRILLISADADTFVPRASSEALWSSIARSVTQHDRIIMPGGHVQPGANELILTITGRVTEWMQKKDLL